NCFSVPEILNDTLRDGEAVARGIDGCAPPLATASPSLSVSFRISGILSIVIISDRVVDPESLTTHGQGYSVGVRRDVSSDGDMPVRFLLTIQAPPRAPSRDRR